MCNWEFQVGDCWTPSQAPNKQFEPTVMRRHMRAASASLHYALAARWTAQRAAAQLRRYVA